MPTQTSPNLIDLMRVLTAATENHSLTWKKTVEEGTFRAQIRQGYVRIAWDSEGGAFRLSMFDEEGTLVEEYSPESQEESGAFQNLYKNVRRRVLNLETKLHGLYDQLKHLAGES